MVNNCPLCGAAGDTAHHRVWCCPATAPEREKLPTWLVSEARQASPSSRFWITGVFPHPGDICPRPSSILAAECVDADGTSHGGIDNWGVEGDVNVDGSCTRKTVKELQRAASAVVVMGPDRKPLKVIRAAVPSPLPQTPQAAEFMAFMLAFRFLQGRAVIHSDCKNVVDTVNAGFPLAMDAKRTYAGLLRDMLKWQKQRGYLEAVRKVKAHQNVSVMDDGEERRRAEGNAAADEHAKGATALHPSPPQQVTDEVGYWLARSELVARTVARAMAKFPPMGKRLNKVRCGSIRPRAAARVPAPARLEGESLTPLMHDWWHAGGKWRCKACAKMCCDEHVPARLLRQKCGGPRTQISVSAMSEQGHDMAIAASHLPSVICIRCGAYALRRVYAKLRNECAPATKKGQQAIERLHRGLPPWDAVGRAAIVGTTATLRGKWDRAQGWVGLSTGPREYDDQHVHEANIDQCLNVDGRQCESHRGGTAEGLHRPTEAHERLTAVRRRVREKEAVKRASSATQLAVHAVAPGPLKRPREDADHGAVEGDERVAASWKEARKEADHMVTPCSCVVLATAEPSGGLKSRCEETPPAHSGRAGSSTDGIPRAARRRREDLPAAPDHGRTKVQKTEGRCGRPAGAAEDGADAAHDASAGNLEAEGRTSTQRTSHKRAHSAQGAGPRHDAEAMEGRRPGYSKRERRLPGQAAQFPEGADGHAAGKKSVGDEAPRENSWRSVQTDSQSQEMESDKGKGGHIVQPASERRGCKRSREQQASDPHVERKGRRGVGHRELPDASAVNVGGSSAGCSATPEAPTEAEGQMAVVNTTSSSARRRGRSAMHAGHDEEATRAQSVKTSAVNGRPNVMDERRGDGESAAADVTAVDDGGQPASRCSARTISRSHRWHEGQPHPPGGPHDKGLVSDRL